MTTGGAVPVGDDELAALFDPLRAYASVALAVSGGGDSLALMHLYARWRELGGVVQPALVVTIDHGLRASSTEEARFVANEAAGLGLSHETLPWTGIKPTSGLQNAAREARYRLLAMRLARESKPAAIVTAHTRDDQAETLLMRLARGSGVGGLSGMTLRRPLPGADGRPSAIDLVRPLLTVPGARLRASLLAAGRRWIDDPTNANLDHERPRLRAARPTLDELGLTDAALARTSERLRRADEAIEAATLALAAAAMTEIAGLSATLDRAAFDDAPAEIRIRLLGHILARLGGEHPRARLLEVERLVARLERSANGPMSGTLAGCRIAAVIGRLDVWRETGRAGLPAVTLQPGETDVWDRRFEVRLDFAAPGPVDVRALAGNELAGLRCQLPHLLALSAPVGIVAAAGTQEGGTAVIAPAGGPIAGEATVPWFHARGLPILAGRADFEPLAK